MSGGSSLISTTPEYNTVDHVRYSTLHPGKILRCYWYSLGLDTIIPGWTFSNLPDRARQIQRRDRVFRSASGYNHRSTVLHRLYSRDRNHHRETRCQDASLRRRHPAVRSITGQQHWAVGGSLWGLFAGHRPVEQSASTQTQYPSKTELIWLDRAHSIGKLQQQPLIRLNSRELSSSPSVWDLGVIIDSGLTLTTHVSILARTCFYQLRRIRQAKKNLDEDRPCQNISPCTSPLTPGLLQLGTGQLARSNAWAAHSCPAFCCTAYSKSPEIGFRIAGNDGAPLAPTPSSNNIQIVYIGARHPPWSLPKIHEGDGSSPIYLAGPRAPSVCRDPELRHPSR